ncbi:hypothetical protein J6590_101386 [Homalodisca vitripennis]|nr:hypothetical protein J6590_101386 [Homalodisca vitripennis]
MVEARALVTAIDRGMAKIMVRNTSSKFRNITETVIPLQSPNSPSCRKEVV